MRAFVALVTACTLLFSTAVSFACSLAAWDYSELATGAEAIIHGRAVRVEDGGRTAVLSVTAYVGKGRAPKEVRVGPTEYSGSVQYDCPDSSVTFGPNQDYLVLLAEGAPTFSLAYPKWATAFPVDEHGMVAVSQVTDEKRPVSTLLESFAAEHNLPKPGGTAKLSAVALVALSVAGLVIWLRRRH